MDYRHTQKWWALRPWQRHSLVLFVAGLVYVAYGGTLLLQDPIPTRQVNLKLLFDMAPPFFWGVVWVIVGTLAVISTRWPPQSKTWGYTALSALAAGWASAYLSGILFLDVPGNAISGALVWYLVAFLWWAISGLMNPGDLPKEA